MQNNIIGIIPARGGSKGVPKKNIKLLKGYPLIAYSIIASKLSEKINRTVISTDSEEIAEICRHYGAEVPFMRPSELAGDKSTDFDFVLHAINWFQNNEKKVPDYFVHIRPTTPLRDPKIIDTAISIIEKDSNSTSLRSGHLASESPFKWFVKNEEGFFKPIVNNITTDQANSARQGFPDVYVPDGYVDVLKIDFIKKSNLLHGDKMIGFESPFCSEVDTLEDFEYLEFQIDKKGSVIYDYLKANY